MLLPTDEKSSSHSPYNDWRSNKTLSHSKHSKMEKLQRSSSSSIIKWEWDDDDDDVVDVRKCFWGTAREIIYRRLPKHTPYSPTLCISISTFSSSTKSPSQHQQSTPHPWKQKSDNTDAAHLRRVNANKSCIIRPIRESHTHISTYTRARMNAIRDGGGTARAIKRGEREKLLWRV